MDYLKDTPQFVRLGGSVSEVVGCISGGDETEYRQLVDNCVAWSEENHLVLNVTKTKEMVVASRRARPELSTISILGVKVQVAESYKYLGVHVNN